MQTTRLHGPRPANPTATQLRRKGASALVGFAGLGAESKGKNIARIFLNWRWTLLNCVVWNRIVVPNRSDDSERCRTGRILIINEVDCSGAWKRVLTQASPSGSTQLRDRKSTRLNSSHVANAYDVCCWKKKKPAVR